MTFRMIISAAVLSLCACGADEADPAAAVEASPDVATAPPGCHVLQVQSDGSCCGAGQIAGDDGCVQIGPPECADAIFDGAAVCTPRWCWDHLDAAEEPCVAGEPGCAIVGRACTAAELAGGAGCLAGERPQPGVEGVCVPAGWPWDGELPPIVTPTWTDDDGVECAAGEWSSPEYDGACLPAGDVGGAWFDSATPRDEDGLFELPPIVTPRWCWGDDEQARACTGKELADGVGCPAGAVPSPDVAGECEPAPGPNHCPRGFVPAKEPTAEGAPAPCKPDPDDCGTDPFGAAPDAGDVVYVDGSAAAAGDGTMAAPFTTIGEAVSAAADGGTVLAAAGKYVENLLIDRSVTLRGRCAEMVTVVGLADAPAIKVVAGKGRIERLTIEALAEAVVVEGGAIVEIARLLVATAATNGLAVTGEGTEAALTESIVSGVMTSAEDHPVAVKAREGAHLDIRNVRLTNNRFLALSVKGPSTTTVYALLADGTLAEDGVGGAGLIVSQDTVVRTVGSRMSANNGTSMGALGNGTIKSVGLLVDATQVAENGKAGYAVQVHTGGHVSLVSSRLTGSTEYGLSILGGSADGAQLLIDDTRPRPLDERGGSGVGVELGGSAVLTSSRVTGSHVVGVQITGVGASLDTSGLLVDQTGPDVPTQLYGYGLQVSAGATADLRGTRLSRNTSNGLHIGDTATAVDAIGLVIDHTIPKPVETDDPTRGINILGGKLVLSSSRLTRNPDGAHAALKGVLVASNVLIDHAMGEPSNSVSGQGVSVQVQGQAHLTNVRVAAARSFGLLAHRGGVMSGEGVLVDGTQSVWAGGDNGAAVLVEEGGVMRLSGARLSANRYTGVFVRGAESRASFSGLLLDGTLPGTLQQAGGLGAYVDAGATFEVLGGRISDNVLVGIRGFDTATLVRAVGVVVADTSPGANGEYGDGIGVFMGAELHLESALFERNQSTGVTAAEAAAYVDNTVVVDTRPGQLLLSTGEEVSLADGIAVLLPIHATIRRTLTARNPRAGLNFQDCEDARAVQVASTENLYGIAVAPGSVVSIESSGPFDNSLADLAADQSLPTPDPPELVTLGGSENQAEEDDPL